MPPKTKHSDPVSTTKGWPLDLSIEPVSLDSVAEPQGKQRSVTRKFQVENGISISENKSTQNSTLTQDGRVKHLLQPTAGADPFKIPSQRTSMASSIDSAGQHNSNIEDGQVTTNDCRIPQSGWLKRAKKFGSATPAGHKDHQKQRDVTD